MKELLKFPWASRRRWPQVTAPFPTQKPSSLSAEICFEINMSAWHLSIQKYPPRPPGETLIYRNISQNLYKIMNYRNVLIFIKKYISKSMQDRYVSKYSDLRDWSLEQEPNKLMYGGISGVPRGILDIQTCYTLNLHASIITATRHPRTTSCLCIILILRIKSEVSIPALPSALFMCRYAGLG